LVASVAAFSLEGYAAAVQGASDAGFDLIEVNLSCPNVHDAPQIGYDFEQSERVLTALRPLCKQPFGVKLPPYFDPVHQERMAAILLRSGVEFVTLIQLGPATRW